MFAVLLYLSVPLAAVFVFVAVSMKQIGGEEIKLEYQDKTEKTAEFPPSASLPEAKLKTVKLFFLLGYMLYVYVWVEFHQQCKRLNLRKFSKFFCEIERRVR